MGGQALGALTPEDISTLMGDPSPESRERIVRKVANQYDHEQLNENEEKVAVEIFLLVLGDKEASVRQAMAEELKGCDKAPSHVMEVLAEDREDKVAVPVLRESAVLTESNLLDIIRGTDKPVRLMAVAERQTLNELISEKLIEKKVEEVVLRLLHNQGADINQGSYNDVADTYYNNQAMLKALIKRKPMPSKAIKRCVNNAMDSARHSIQAHQLNTMKSDEKQVKDEAVRQATEKARILVKELQVLGRSPSPYECEKMAGDLIRVGRLSAEVMLVALCLGHIRFFAASMAKRASIPFEKAGAICSTPHEQIFEALYKKADMPEQLRAIYVWLLERDIEKLVDGMVANADDTAVMMATELQTAMVAGVIPYSDVASKLTVGLVNIKSN